MPTTNLVIDRKALKEAEKTLENVKNGFVRAWARALNTAATGMQSEMVKMAQVDYAYKTGAAKKRIEVNKAKWSRLEASTVSKGEGVHLSDFVGSRQTKAGVSVNVKKSSGRKVIDRAFINKADNSGKLLVMRRPGNPGGQHEKLYGRYGPPGSGRTGGKATIDVFYGPHPEIVYNKPENWAKLQASADGRLTAAFEKETDAVLRQYG